jgi:prevent-host-death family protein
MGLTNLINTVGLTLRWCAMATYNIYEAKTSFSRLVEEATHGEEVVIAKAGEPVVRLVPIVKKKAGAKRKFGGNFLGITFMAPDFYDDLPLEMFEVMRDDDGDKKL